LSRRIGNPAALDFLRWVLRGGVTVDEPAPNSLAQLLAISERFSDLPLDLADASIAEAAARMRARQVLTIDADFDIYRDAAGKPLRNVLRHRA
jgi:predicted nucleic acid-binding protein